MRGAFGQDIDLVGALGGFAKWLPDDFVDTSPLQPLLDAIGRRAAGGALRAAAVRAEAAQGRKDRRQGCYAMFGGGVGKTLVLDNTLSLQNEVGFDLNVKDLAKHTSYRGRGSLGQFKSTPRSIDRTQHPGAEAVDSRGL